MKTILVIEANGGVRDTRVTSSDGRDLTHLITAVRWSHNAGDAPQAEIEVMCTPGRMQGAVNKITDQAGREIRRIVYADGTELSSED